MKNQAHAAGGIILALSLLLPLDSLAEDQAALYKSKCSVCHGSTGSGRSAIKDSSLLTEEVRKRSDRQLAEAISKGGADGKSNHAYEKKGVTPEQVNLLVQHIRDLQGRRK